MLTRHAGKPSAVETVEVSLVQAKPDPIRDVPPVAPDDHLSPTWPAVARRPSTRAHLKPRLREQAAPPEVAVKPSTEVATADDVALPATAESAQHKAGQIANPSPPSPPPPAAGRGSGPITVLASPRYRSNPRPDYPMASRRRHEEGEVRLAVRVSPEGRPLHISLAKSSGHARLDQAAIDAVRTWTFEPARASGVAVTSQVIVPVRFSLAQD